MKPPLSGLRLLLRDPRKASALAIRLLGDTWRTIFQTLMFLPPDFPWEDLEELLRQLQDADLLTPGFIPPEVGLYNLHAWIYQVHVEKVAFWIFPDRNLVSRMAQLSRGEPLTDDRRPAAILMAFAQHIDVNFEPSIAYHELAFNLGNERAFEELGWFRAGDNASRRDWLDLAIGRKGSLPRTPPNSDVPTGNLALPLRRWRRNYILALTIAELELQSSSALSKVETLLDWMFDEFFLAGPATLFACLYFAPSAPRSRMLKKLRSLDREQALAGLKNTAWDITYLSEFVRQIQENGSETKRFLLATSDKALSRTACMLFHRDDSKDPAQMADRLKIWWKKPGDAERIAGKYFGLVARVQEPARKLRNSALNDFVSSLTSEKEARIRAWKPK